MDKFETYLEENSGRFLDELSGLIRIPSISSLERHKPDMLAAAEYWKKILLEAGVDRAEIFQTPGNPVVFAEKMIVSAAHTILIFAHMDV